MGCKSLKLSELKHKGILSLKLDAQVEDISPALKSIEIPMELFTFEIPRTQRTQTCLNSCGNIKFPDMSIHGAQEKHQYGPLGQIDPASYVPLTFRLRSSARSPQEPTRTLVSTSLPGNEQCLQ